MERKQGGRERKKKGGEEKGKEKKKELDPAKTTYYK